MPTRELQKPIGKRTPLTIGLVVSLLGMTGWLTDLRATGEANSSDIRELKIGQSETSRTIHRVEKWLSAIGQKLGVPEPRE